MIAPRYQMTLRKTTMHTSNISGTGGITTTSSIHHPLDADDADVVEAVR